MYDSNDPSTARKAFVRSRSPKVSTMVSSVNASSSSGVLIHSSPSSAIFILAEPSSPANTLGYDSSSAAPITRTTYGTTIAMPSPSADANLAASSTQNAITTPPLPHIGAITLSTPSPDHLAAAGSYFALRPGNVTCRDEATIEPPRASFLNMTGRASTPISSSKSGMLSEHFSSAPPVLSLSQSDETAQPPSADNATQMAVVTAAATAAVAIAAAAAIATVAATRSASVHFPKSAVSLLTLPQRPASVPFAVCPIGPETNQSGLPRFAEITSDEFATLLNTTPASTLLVLDVRSFFAFNHSHVRDAINICVGEGLAKRPAFSVKMIEGFIPSTHKPRFHDRTGKIMVLYDEHCTSQNSTALLRIAQKLHDEDQIEQLFVLQDPFAVFASKFPEWTTISQYVRPSASKRSRTASSPASPLPSGATGATCTSNLVQVLDWLYIGDDDVAADARLHESKNIHYILNVARECRNHFQHDPRYHYLRMDLADNPDQHCQLPVFEEACRFIDRGHAHNSSVLVHCRAGRSRSVTVVLAYLMTRKHWTLDYAYDYLRQRRPNICPNLGFMGLLLKVIPNSGTCCSTAASSSSSASVAASADHLARTPNGSLRHPLPSS